MAINIFAMPSSSIILLLSVALGVNALPWSGAQETKVYNADEWTPRPTAVPVNPAELFKRSSVDVQICGWIGGKSGNAATCSSGSSCVYDMNHGIVGCCTTEGPCTAGVYTGCVDSNSPDRSPNSGLDNNGIYTCTGTDVCYRNTYPGNYYQFGCGASSWATFVATTYAGQPSDELLQIVYTGVNFTPTSKVSTKTSSSSSSSSSSSTTSSSSSSSTSASSTLAVAGKASESATATSTPAPSKKNNTGIIAGGVVAGVVALAAFSAAILCFGRRRQRKRQAHRAGPFISAHSKGQPPVSGPFQRIQPYSPEDFTDPPRNVGAEADITTAHYNYSDAPTPPFDQTSHFHQRPFLPATAETPLVSEIDDFSRSYHEAIAARDTHIHSGDLPDTVTGLGMGVGAPLHRGNSRTQDRDLTSEAVRSTNVRMEGWSPQRLRTNAGRTVGAMSPINRDSGGSPEMEVPPKSPLRDTLRGFASATIGRDNAPRYQLVDEVVGEDVPILHSPGQLRQSRGVIAKRSDLQD